MFKGIGQTETPSEVPGIIVYINQASADCTRVLSDELGIMRATAKSTSLTSQQSAQLTQLIDTNLAKCQSSGGGGDVITPGGPAIPPSHASPDFFGGLGTIGIIAAIAVVGLLMMKR